MVSAGGRSYGTRSLSSLVALAAPRDKQRLPLEPSGTAAAGAGCGAAV